MYKNYLDILDVNEDSSLSEIKKAFRVKAKLFHPDLNKSEDAHEKFVRINEAYEFFLRWFKEREYQKTVTYNTGPRRGETSRKRNSRDYRAYYKAYDSFYKTWFEKGQKKANEKARYYANKRYEDFKNSRLYKTANILNTIFNYMYYLIGIFTGILFLLVFGIIGFNLVFQVMYKDGSGKAVVLSGCLLFCIFIFMGIWKFIKSKRYKLIQFF